tara:strand:- start:4795 stop:5151 length:357 start_codon:yes stop_codon:yes gene_type:complete
MKTLTPTWKIFITYLLAFLCLCFSSKGFAQIRVIHFNADWNKQNNVDWFTKLSDCDRETLLIEENDNQKKYNIAIVPTILIIKDGEEVKRYQADLSFTMVATRKEIQNYINDLLMEDF